jgi:hypothetical protein
VPPSITFEQYAYYQDQDSATNLQINDQSIVQNTIEEKQDKIDENSSESEDEEVVRPSITRKQAMKKIDDLRYYLECQPNTSEQLQKLEQFENSINLCSVEKQTIINDFFRFSLIN